MKRDVVGRRGRFNGRRKLSSFGRALCVGKRKVAPFDQPQSLISSMTRPAPTATATEIRSDIEAAALYAEYGNVKSQPAYGKAFQLDA